MITNDEIRAVAKLMKIEIDDYEEHAEKIRKMIEYFDHLDSVALSDTFQRGITVTIDSLRDDVVENTGAGADLGLKFGGGEHMHSPKLR